MKNNVKRQSSGKKKRVGQYHEPINASLTTGLLMLSIFQIFIIPVGTIWVPLILIVMYATISYGDFSKYWKDPIVLSGLGLLVMQIISLIWSPDRAAGIRDLIYEGGFLCTFIYFRTRFVEQPEKTIASVRIYCAVMVISSISIIVFRFFPSIEASYWHNFTANFFVGPNTMSQFNSGIIKNNVADSLKSGGFFAINANIAGIFTGIVFFLTLAIYRERKVKFWGYAIAAFHFAAAATCGSKATLLLLFIAPILFLASRLFVSLRGTKLQGLAIYAYVIIALILYFVYNSLLSNIPFLQDSENTLGTRSIMWTHGFQRFLEVPFQGEGYGGWTQSFFGTSAWYGMANFPPHNALLILWSQSGLIALILGITLIVFFLKRLFGLISIKAPIAFGLTSAVILYTMQTMGENCGLISENHCYVQIAVILALASVAQVRSSIGEKFRGLLA